MKSWVDNINDFHREPGGDEVPGGVEKRCEIPSKLYRGCKMPSFHGVRRGGHEVTGYEVTGILPVTSTTGDLRTHVPFRSL